MQKLVLTDFSRQCDQTEFPHKEKMVCLVSVFLFSLKELMDLKLGATLSLPLCHQNFLIQIFCLKPFEAKQLPHYILALGVFFCHRCFSLKSGKSLKFKADLHEVLLRVLVRRNRGPSQPAPANLSILTPHPPHSPPPLHWQLLLRILTFTEKSINYWLED